MKILIDTSFLLACVRKGVDVFDTERYGQLLLPREVIDELGELKRKGKPVEKRKAKLVLDIIEENGERFKEVELNEKYVDKGIEDYVKREKVAVATLDRELKNRLKGKAKILTVKGGKRIDWS